MLFTQRSLFLFSSVFTAALAQGCSGGGRVTVTPGQAPQVTVQAQAAPAPTTNLMNSDQALEKLLSQTDTAGIAQVSQQILSHHAEDFRWDLFWQGLQKRDGVNTQIPLSTDLISLASEACDQDSYSAFADFVLSWGVDLSPLLSDPRACALSLSDAQRRRALTLLQSRLSPGAAPSPTPSASPAPMTFSVAQTSLQIAQLVVEENRYRPFGSLADPTADENTLSTLSPAQWSSVTQSLQNQNQSALMVQMVLVQNQVSGSDSSPLLKSLGRPLLLDSGSLTSSLQSLGLANALRIINGLHLDDINGTATEAAIPQDSLERSLKQLLAEFSAELPKPSQNPVDNEAAQISSWQDAWQKFVLMRSFLDTVESRLSLETALDSLEKLHRGMESSFNGSPLQAAQAIAFLNGKVEPSIDQQWFIFRLVLAQGKRSFSTLKLASFSSQQSPLSSIVLKRLKAETDTDPVAIHADQNSFCAALASMGMPAKQVSWDSWISDPEKVLKTRGCIEVSVPNSTSSAALSADINLENVVMPFDTRVRIPEAHLRITANSLDGSMLDLSYDETLSAKASSPTRDAVLLPLSFCLQESSNSGLIKAGRPCFPAHLPYQQPVSGGQGDEPVAAGARGGKLVLNINDSSRSFVPSVVALEAGGHGDLSDLNFDDVDSWYTTLNALLPQGQAPFTFRRETTAVLMRAYLRKADTDPTDPTKTLVYIHPDFLKHIAAAKAAEIQSICSQQASLDACLKNDLGQALFTSITYALNQATNAGDIIALQQPHAEIPAAPNGMRADAITISLGAGLGGNQ